MTTSLITSSPAMPISMFAPFPRLPAEIRLFIWSLCRIPRIVCIRRGTDFDAGNNTAQPAYCRARASLPAMLCTCRESREFALQFYKKCFRLQLLHAIYFDPSIDSLFMTDIATSNAFYRATLVSCQLLKSSCIGPLQTPEKAFCVAVQFERTPSPHTSESELMRGLMALSALFPFLNEFLVVGYSPHSSSDWTEAIMQVAIPRVGSQRKRQGPYILGQYQLINGSLEEKEYPSRLLPKMVFLSQDQSISWSSLTV